MNFLFSLQGRIGRLQWWGGQFAIIGIWFAAIMVMSVALGGASIDAEAFAQNGDSSALLGLAMFLLPVFIVTIWINVAVTVKRFHDRNKSGFWFFIILVPYIGGLWQLVECGFLSGTPGGNDYGIRGGGNSSSSDEHVTSHANLDDLIAERLVERQNQGSIQQGNGSNGRFSNDKPVFGQRR